MYRFAPPENIEVAVAPILSQIPSIPVQFTRAAQDVGESAQKLEGLGVKYCLAGHSFRRNNFGETNEIVQEKIRRLRENRITPIVCAQNIGEIPADIKDCFVMYEPSKAISTNSQYHSETPEEINAALRDFPKNVRLLYGGSVNPQNCSVLIAHCPLLFGFVVGHASLDEAEFSRIISSVYASKT